MVKSILALNCGYIQAHKHPGLFHTLLTGVLRITVRMNVALKFHQWNLLLVTALALNCHFHRYIFLLLKLAKLLLACHGVATFSAQENQQWGMGDKALILGLLSCLFFSFVCIKNPPRMHCCILLYWQRKSNSKFPLGNCDALVKHMQHRSITWAMVHVACTCATQPFQRPSKNFRTNCLSSGAFTIYEAPL